MTASTTAPMNRILLATTIMMMMMMMASFPPLATSSSYSYSSSYSSYSIFTQAPAFLTAACCASSGSSRNTATAAMPRLPPSKGDFYNDDELFNLLTIHQTLHADTTSTNDESGVLGSGMHDWVLQTLQKDDGHGSVGRARSDVDDDDNDNGTNSIKIHAIPDLHKFVVETVGEIGSSSSSSSISPSNRNQVSLNQLAFEYLQKLLRDRKPSIRAIATGSKITTRVFHFTKKAVFIPFQLNRLFLFVTDQYCVYTYIYIYIDVDGTLLSGQYMHPITQDAVLRGIQQAYDDDDKSRGSSSTTTNKILHFFPATGKSRLGAMGSLGPIVGPLLHKCPGVYIQGLYCLDREGNVIFEKRLSSEAIRAAEELVSTFNISIVGYDGDDLYTTKKTDVVLELSEFYGEPTVEVLMNKENHSTIKLAQHDRGMHKLLLMDNDIEKLDLVRVSLEELAKKHDATVTQALPTMLELLPAGCSKADGVQRVCEALGIDPSKELLALGDAENDTGLLRMACIGVAVANACPLARDAADFIMRERHDEGGAGLAMNMFAFDE